MRRDSFKKPPAGYATMRMPQLIRALPGAAFAAVIAAVIAAVVAVGCSESATGSGPLPSLTGRWDFTAQLVNTSSGLSCSDTGTFTLVQRDTQLTGISDRYRICGAAASAYTLRDSIVNGVIDGHTVRLSLKLPYAATAECVDTVTINADASSLVARGTCGLGGIAWQASRAAVVGSVSLSPPNAATLKGGGVSLTATVRNAAGARTFARTLAWSSSNSSIASVDSVGQVSALAGGTATITATSEGKSGTATIVVAPELALVSVYAGDAATCGLDANGTAYCWGRAVFNGPSWEVPVAVPGALRFSGLTVGHDFVCGLTLAGDAYCWGWNAAGGLGNQSSTALPPAPTLVGGGLSFSTLSAGESHVCGITPANLAYCWGDNAYGMLGRGNAVPSSTPVAVNGGVYGDLSFKSISAGARHTCGITPDGVAYCWGLGSSGALGTNTIGSFTAPNPVSVRTSLRWVSISAGGFHTCGVATTTEVYCWGRNDGGALGEGTVITRAAPTLVMAGTGFVSVTAGHNHSCALKANGEAWCWGVDSWGQLGRGFQTSMSTYPAAVSGGVAFRSLVSGYYTFSDESVNEGTGEHTCGVSTSGVTYCWGVNIVGQLGIGLPRRFSSNVPVKVAGQP